MSQSANGTSCIVIGAGVAGLTCAHSLQDAGWNVRIVEKSRAIGGRMSTRVTDWGPIDHGAQYATAKDKPFRGLMTGLANKGTVTDWKPEGKETDHEWHIGTNGMNQMLTPLADGLSIEFQVTAAEIREESAKADVLLDNGEKLEADLIVIAAPSPQALKLTGGKAGPFSQLNDVVYAPCYAGLFVFENRLEDVPDFLRGEGNIGWAARCNSRPARLNNAERWIVHGSPEWSRTVLETDKREMAGPMLEQFSQFLERDLPEPIYSRAHRWRYALVEKPLGEPFLLSEHGRIAVIGDGMLGGRVEAAFESARQLVDHIKQR